MLTGVSGETIGDVFVVGPQGRLDGNGALALEKFLGSNPGNASKHVLFDFSGLDYISSAGLRVILLTAKKLQAGAGKVALCALNQDIQKVFEMSGFNTIVDISPSRELALSDLSAGS